MVTTAIGDAVSIPVPEIKRMLEVKTKPGGGYHVTINASSLDMIQTCLRKSQYQLRDNLVPHDKSMGIIFGSGIHKALEVFYEAPRELRILPPNYKQKLELICQGHKPTEDFIIYKAAWEFYNEVGLELSGLPDTDKRSLSNAAWLLGEYFESRINDPYEVYVHNGTPCVETMYECDFFDSKSLTIRIHGTVDAILQNKANGNLIICDHKTTSATNMNDFFNRTKPNHQYSLYVYLVEKALGLGIENFMINVFQVKARPKTAKGSGPNFLNIMTKRTPEDLAEFEKSLLFYVRQYILCLETGHFPLGTANACANYGQCAFLKVCESPASIQSSILSAEFKERGK